MSSANSTSFSTLEQLVNFIGDEVASQYRLKGVALSGATLANAIRRQDPHLKWESIGIARMGDAVRAAEDRGLIAREESVKHLALRPGPASGITVSPIHRVNNQDDKPYLRPEIWRAFVFISQPTRQLFDRKSGRVVRVNTDEMPVNQGAQDQVVEINPISEEDQLAWIQEFLESHPGIDFTIPDEPRSNWWIDWAKTLKTIDKDLLYAWRRFHTPRVISYVRKWADQNSIRFEVLTIASPSTQRNVEKTVDLASHHDRTRRAILSAISDMPTEELERISIPIHYLLRHIKAT